MHPKLLQSCPTLCYPMPTRFLCPWDSPGKNTGVGCHTLLQGNLHNPGIKPTTVRSPALAGRFFKNSIDRGAWWAVVLRGHKELDTTEHGASFARQAGKYKLSWKQDVFKLY